MLSQDNSKKKSQEEEKTMKSQGEQIEHKEEDYPDMRLKINNIWELTNLKNGLFTTQTNLKYQLLLLDLTALRLNQASVKDLSEILAQMKNLKDLALYAAYTHLAIYSIEQISSSFKNIINLKMLYFELQGNHLYDQGLVILSNGVLHLKNLKIIDLNLRGNHIQNRSFIYLMNVLAQLPNLCKIYLNFGYNSINESCSSVVPYCINQLKNLLVFQLYLCENDINPIKFLSEQINITQALRFFYIDLETYKVNFKQNLTPKQQLTQEMEKLIQYYYNTTIYLACYLMYNDFFTDDQKFGVDILYDLYY